MKPTYCVPTAQIENFTRIRIILVAHSPRDIRLDAVRGVAILLAMGWHLNRTTGVPLIDVALWPGKTIGWAGVDLFFVLSGFLVGRLIMQEIVKTEHFNLKTFFLRRAFRLWPVLYLYLAAQVLMGSQPVSSFLPQTLFHVQNYFPIPFSHLWSLAVEEHFYLVAGLFFPILLSKGYSPYKITIVLITVLISTVALRHLALISGSTYLQIQTFTHFRLDSLSVGVLMATLFVFSPNKFAALTGYPFIWFVVCLLAWGAVVALEDTVFKAVYSYVFAYIGSVALIFLVLHKEAKATTFLGRSYSIFAFFGIWSYSLYIWHNAFAGVGEQVASKILPEPSNFVLVAAGYTFAIVGSIFVSKLVERPGMMLRDRMFPPPSWKNEASVSSERANSKSASTR